MNYLLKISAIDFGEPRASTASKTDSIRFLRASARRQYFALANFVSGSEP